MSRFTTGLLLVVSATACHSAAVRPAPVVAETARPAPVVKAATPAMVPVPTPEVKAVPVDATAEAAAEAAVAAPPPSTHHERRHRLARSSHHRERHLRHESSAETAAVVPHKAERTLEERELKPTPMPDEDTLADTASPNMDRDSLNQFVRARIHSIQSCYEKELRLHTTLHGGISVRFDVTPSGRVRHSRVESDTIHDSAVSSCVVDHINEWVTPFKPASSVRVSFPFVFGPSEDAGLEPLVSG